jgi:hypothetical protein
VIIDSEICANISSTTLIRKLNLNNIYIYIWSNVKNFIDQNETKLEASKLEYTDIYKQREQATLNTNIALSTWPVETNYNTDHNQKYNPAQLVTKSWETTAQKENINNKPKKKATNTNI